MNMDILEGRERGLPLFLFFCFLKVDKRYEDEKEDDCPGEERVCVCGNKSFLCCVFFAPFLIQQAKGLTALFAWHAKQKQAEASSSKAGRWFV